jgi:NitT/TauT family transport system substrate-binding protein
MMALLLLEKYGLSQDEVRLVELPFPRMLAGLSSGSVDAIATAEPFITLGLREGMQVLLHNYLDVRPVTFVSTYVTTEQQLSENGDALSRFVASLEEATELVESDPALARRVLASFTSLSPDVASEVSLPRFSPTIDLQNLTETIGLMERTGLLQRPVDANAVTRALTSAGR